MKKLIYFAFAAASFLLAGCAKAPNEEPEGTIVTLTASIDEEDTKASISEQGEFLWETTDKISVWISNGESGKFKQFTYSSGAGTKNAEFTGSVDTGYAIEWAVFPYNDKHTYSSPILSFIQPQTLDIPNQGNRVPMLANYDSETESLSFKHLDGLMRVTMYNVPSSAVYARLTTSGKQNNGTFSIDKSESTPSLGVIDTETDERTRLNVKITPEDAVGNVVVVNFPMPVGEYSSINITPRKSDWGTYEGCQINSSKTQTITQGGMLLMPEVTFNAVELSDSEDNQVRNNMNNGYDNTEGTQLTVVSNKSWKSVTNASKYALKVDASKQDTSSSETYKGGYFLIKTQKSDYNEYTVTNFRQDTQAFAVKIRYNNEQDASNYYPQAYCNGATDESTKRRPDRINGVSFDGTEESWASLIKPNDWNILQWTCDNTGTWRVEITPFLTFEGSNAIAGSRIMYFDDFRFLK